MIGTLLIGPLLIVIAAAIPATITIILVKIMMIVTVLVRERVITIRSINWLLSSQYSSHPDDYCYSQY